jgi:hypothetical protein
LQTFEKCGLPSTTAFLNEAAATMQRLVDWLDRRGDLMSNSALIFQLGPIMVLSVVLTLIWENFSGGVAFWVAAVASACACLVYYIAFEVLRPRKVAAGDQGAWPRADWRAALRGAPRTRHTRRG